MANSAEKKKIIGNSIVKGLCSAQEEYEVLAFPGKGWCTEEVKKQIEESSKEEATREIILQLTEVDVANVDIEQFEREFKKSFQMLVESPSISKITIGSALPRGERMSSESFEIKRTRF